MSTNSKIIKSLRILFWGSVQFITVICSGLILFMIYAMLGTILTYHKPKPLLGDEQMIYVRSNGMHTDICFPITSDFYDWWSFFDEKDFPDAAFKWVAVGWGDKDFYIETESWDDLKLSTLASSLFLPTESALHVEMLTYEPAESDNCVRVMLTPTGYIELGAYVAGSFQFVEWQPAIIDGASYNGNDRFYLAKRSYHLFQTCNSWTNQGLKYAGAKTVQWAIFPSSILTCLRTEN